MERPLAQQNKLMQVLEQLSSISTNLLTSAEHQGKKPLIRTANIKRRTHQSSEMAKPLAFLDIIIFSDESRFPDRDPV